MLALLPPLEYLLLAALLGAIVGLENEYRMQNGVRIFLGLRTSIFISVLGYVSSLFYLITSSPEVLVATFGVITVIATAMYIEKSQILKDPGATTFSGVFILFLSGLLVGLGYFEYAIVLSVLLAAVSFYKREFLNVIHKLKRKEVIATLNLLIIFFVILPLLPDNFIGPYAFFNPFEFWMIVATVGLVFFIQYLILRFSKFGLFLSSIIGSAITGTAITLTLLRLGNSVKKAVKPIFYNIMFSSNIPMIFGQGALVIYAVTFSPQILYYLLPVLIVSFVFLLAFLFLGKKEFGFKMSAPQNPFPILQTIKFAILFFVIFTVSRLVNIFIPQFLTLTMFISGLANVAGSAFSLGFFFLNGDISASYTAFLLGLVIGASVVEKGFLALLSRNKLIRIRVFGYSLLMGAFILITAFVSYYGIQI